MWVVGKTIMTLFFRLDHRSFDFTTKVPSGFILGTRASAAWCFSSVSVACISQQGAAKQLPRFLKSEFLFCCIPKHFWKLPQRLWFTSETHVCRRQDENDSLFAVGSQKIGNDKGGKWLPLFGTEVCTAVSTCGYKGCCKETIRNTKSIEHSIYF